MEFFIAQSVLILTCLIGTAHITSHQSSPYMDEIFHIPQAQKYCNGSFQEWDPMITTLPGLYIFSTGLLKPLEFLIEDSCSVMNLRMVNTVFAAGNFYLLYAITRILNRNEEEWQHILKAFTLSLMPLLFFFNFLYYTDPGALFFVLYAYYYHLQGDYVKSSISGIVSLVFRQTNIIWVFFMALCNVSRNIHRQIKFEESKEKKTLYSLMSHSLPVLVMNTMVNSWSYLIVGLTAIAFVLYNGSIVVGDKTAHEASFNPPQLGYMACFTLGLSLPHLFSLDKVKRFISSLWQNKFLTIACVAVSIALVYKFTQEHAYLLADNRHYTFYVWSKVYRRFELARYILIPVYLYALWSIDDSLSHMSWMIRASLWICISAALIPQKLMEFRYFIVPYMLARLHMKFETTLSMVLELAIYLAINIVTVYIFLYKPIFWPQDHTPYRIMW